MQTVYRLYWTTDVGFAGTDNVDYSTLEAAQAAATDGLTWKHDERDTWRSTRDQYGDAYTVRRAYR